MSEHINIHGHSYFPAFEDLIEKAKAEGLLVELAVTQTVLDADTSMSRRALAEVRLVRYKPGEAPRKRKMIAKRAVIAGDLDRASKALVGTLK